jgi:hypothetical protein
MEAPPFIEERFPGINVPANAMPFTLQPVAGKDTHPGRIARAVIRAIAKHEASSKEEAGQGILARLRNRFAIRGVFFC